MTFLFQARYIFIYSINTKNVKTTMILKVTKFSLAFSPFFPFITSLYRFIYFSTSLTVTSIPELLNLLFIIIFDFVL
ncbi:hypothetical protein A9L44_06900 [Staphylococcus aureus]|nr:hypothetical protein AA961_13650 [Staphylococcus aureus]KIQ98573.1 hypothetical protein SZ17_12735 [Staphylococcus aureus]KIT60913.1 hypothetical protein PY38_12890 [Staphylococcus aureus]KOQ10371.1 hypothetical protein ABW32_11495 [Staphylococcus aureus]MCU4258399.1 hypothetical protein [Staphylococcus aureus]